MAGDQLSGIDQKVGGPSSVGAGSGSGVDPQSFHEHSRFHWIRKIRAAIRHHPPLDFTWRAVVLVLGCLIIASGIAMLVLPGPGWAAIFVGLAVLATEFDWAHRILHRARVKMHEARERARDPKVRRRMIALTLAVLLVAGGAAWWYVETFGITVPSWLLR
jgi:uncharacterized protein (TIGR02611 family)